MIYHPWQRNALHPCANKGNALTGEKQAVIPVLKRTEYFFGSFFKTSGPDLSKRYLIINVIMNYLFTASPAVTGAISIITNESGLMVLLGRGLSVVASGAGLYSAAGR